MNYLCSVIDMLPGDTPSSRIARWLSVQFQGRLLDSAEAITSSQREVLTMGDPVFVVNGPVKFSKHRDEMAGLLESVIARRQPLVYVENDYTMNPPRPMWLKGRRALYTRWTNCEGGLRYPQDVLVNWNALSYSPYPQWPLPPIPRQVFYHGAFRQGRVSSFERYFRNPSFPLSVATTKAASGKFHQLCGDEVMLQPPVSLLSLRKKGLSLYVEDEVTHRVYHHPSTRFYECLSVKAPMVFDSKCLPTFQRAGIDVSRWVVDSPEQVGKWLERDLEAVAEEQWLEFTKAGSVDFKERVAIQVQSLYDNMKRSKFPQ